MQLCSPPSPSLSTQRCCCSDEDGGIAAVSESKHAQIYLFCFFLGVFLLSAARLLKVSPGRRWGAESAPVIENKKENGALWRGKDQAK